MITNIINKNRDINPLESNKFASNGIVYYDSDGSIMSYLDDSRRAFAYYDIANDHAFYYGLIHDDGPFIGQLVNPKRMFGYGTKYSLDKINKSAFESYLEFLKTKKTRYLERAMFENGKTNG